MIQTVPPTDNTSHQIASYRTARCGLSRNTHSISPRGKAATSKEGISSNFFLALCPFLRQENGPLNEHSTICTHTSHSLHLPDYTEYSRFPPLTDTPTTARQTLTSQDRCYRRWHNRRLICLALRWPWLRLPHLRSVSAASGAKSTTPLACRFTV